MARLASEYILEAVREVLAGGAVSGRQVAASRFTAGATPGISDNGAARMALSANRYDVTISGSSLSKSGTVRQHGLQMYDLEVEVRCFYFMPRVALLDGDERHSVLSIAAQDSDVIHQALSYPGNLTSSSSGATGLAGGAMTHVSTTHEDSFDDGGDGLHKTVHTYRAIGVVQSESL